MKNILWISCGWWMTLLFTSCNHDEVFPDQAFIKMYGGGFAQEGVGVAEMPAGGYLMAGSSTSYSRGNYWDIFVVTTTAEGNATLTRNVSISRNLRTKQLLPIQAGNGGYVVLAQGENASGLSKTYLLRLDKNGNPVGSPVSIRENTSGNDFPTRIASTLDGGFIIVGSTSAVSTLGGSIGPNDPADLLLIRTDANGTLLWDRTYGLSQRDLGADVYPMPDGSFRVLSTSIREGAADQDLLLVSCDSQGLLTNALSFGDAQKNETALRLLPGATAGSWIVFGSKEGQITEVPFLMFLNSDFQSTRIVNYDQQGAQKPTDILPLPSGFALLSSTSTADQSSDWLFQLTDINGTLRSNFSTFGGSKTDTPGAMTASSTGGYLLTGTLTFDNNTMAGLILTDANGEVNGTK